MKSFKRVEMDVALGSKLGEAVFLTVLVQEVRSNPTDVKRWNFEGRLKWALAVVAVRAIAGATKLRPGFSFRWKAC